MGCRREDRPLHLEVAVRALLQHNARIAGDVVEIVPNTWAIHGFIPVDGEVILAEFEHPDVARSVLDQLPATERPGTSRG